LGRCSADSCCGPAPPSRRIIERLAGPSRIDFVSKLEGAQQELDESDLWLEVLSDANVVKPQLVVPLRQETNELIAMFVTMTKHVKSRRPK
jgi:four helix bundle protein